MFQDAFIILKKELKNIFRDRRAVIANYVLPLFLMPVIFITIGRTSEGQEQKAREAVYHLSIMNMEDPRFTRILSENLSYVESGGGIIIRFPEDWEPGNPGTVEIFYDSTSHKSTYAASRIEDALTRYEELLAANLLESRGLTREMLDTLSPVLVDTAPPESRGKDFLVFMVPYMIMIYLFAGAMSVALDCTAGEKERGSLALLLVNQVSRQSIALGKTLFVMISAFINNVATFLGLLIAASFMGNMMGNSTNALSVLTPGRAFIFLLTIVSMGGISASIMVLLGSSAKTMKEGGGYIMPVYIGAIILALSTSQMEAAGGLALNFIPLVNGIFVMKSLLLGQGEFLRVLITLLTNVGVIALFVFFTSRLYSSERILNTV